MAKMTPGYPAVSHAYGNRMNMTQTKTSSASTPKRAPKTLAANVLPAMDHNRTQALANYEAALRLMQAGKYADAHVAFDKLLATGPGDLAERVRMYMNACLQQTSKHNTSFSTPEERYDYAVSLLNDGHYEDAREQFQAILKINDKADYAFYGLAVLASMTGDTHTCLEHLTEAIRQNPRNRFQARSDSDFQDMADDPRFTELLYPEV